MNEDMKKTRIDATVKYCNRCNRCNKNEDSSIYRARALANIDEVIANEPIVDKVEHEITLRDHYITFRDFCMASSCESAREILEPIWLDKVKK